MTTCDCKKAGGNLPAAIPTLVSAEGPQKYLDDNRERFKEQYPDQWIGIVGLRVVVHGNTAEDVLAALRRADEDTGGAVLRHASVEDSTWLLAEGSRCAA